MAQEATEEYRQALNELTNNNKMQINLLTILAEDYAQYSADIVGVIVEQIERVPTSQKLAVMYVADSIVKNVEKVGNYKELFGRVIVQAFVHVFESGDERARSSLYKLRQTWSVIFPRARLYQIDMKVNAIDPAWPVITPSSSRVTPAASTSTSAVTSAVTPAVPSNQIHVNPRFLASSTTTTDNDRQSKENKRATDKAPLQQQQQALVFSGVFLDIAILNVQFSLVYCNCNRKMLVFAASIVREFLALRHHFATNHSIENLLIGPLEPFDWTIGTF